MRGFVALVLVTAATVVGAPPSLRQETVASFPVDDAFQSDGGVQYFFELMPKDEMSDASTSAWPLFSAFDEKGRWAKGPFHVVMSRIVYTVDKDVGFFTEAQANDLEYINAVGPGYDVTRTPDGGFHVGKMPSNTFSIRFLDQAAVRAAASSGGTERLLSLLPDAGLPTSIVVQENVDFARVLGMRTAEASVTWTAHYALGTGRTRLHVCTMSFLHTLPPFFIGGGERIRRASVAGALELIELLRAYQPPDGGT